jgi:hypothetical protein
MGTRMNRVAALGGIGYVVLSMVAIFQSPLPDLDNSPNEVRAFLGTNASAGAWTGAIILLFAMFGLLAFAARLSGELRDAGRRWEIHASLVVSSAVVYGSVTLLATAVDVGVVYRIPNAQPAADAMALFDVAAIAHFLSVAVLAVMCVAAAHVALATRVLPQWTAWLGLVTGAAVLAGTVLLPRTTDPMHYAATALLTWITAVSIVLASRRSADETISGTTPHAETENVQTTG